MWRKCRHCKTNFFQGGRAYQNICPECRYENKRRARIRASNKQTHSVERTFITLRGSILGTERNYPKITCRFCKELKSATRINTQYCINCNNLRPSTKHAAVKCKACGNIYWGKEKNKITYCSPSCKELLREHHECVICSTRINAEKPINTMYCSVDCKHKLTKINNLRKDRDAKGVVFTPELRYKKACKLGVSEKILDEFRRDLNESKNNHSR